MGRRGRMRPSQIDLSRYDPAEPRDAAGKWRAGLGSEAAGLLKEWEKTRGASTGLRSNKVFKQAVASAPTFTGTVYRGVTPKRAYTTSDFTNAYTTGQVVKLGRLSSTSKNSATASGFGRILFEIRDATGADLGNSLNEVLLPAAKYRVVSVTPDEAMESRAIIDGRTTYKTFGVRVVLQRLEEGLDLAFNPAEPRDAAGEWRRGPLFHGSRYRLNPGDILAGSKFKANQGYGNPEPDVYFTNRADVAAHFANAAYGPEKNLDATARIYEVEPVDPSEIEVDPDEPEEAQSYRAPRMRVVREVPQNVLRNLHGVFRQDRKTFQEGNDFSNVDLARPAVVVATRRTEVTEDSVVRSIANLLRTGYRFNRLAGDFGQEVEGIAKLLSPWGIREEAVRMALGLTHTEGGSRRGTAHSPNARLAEAGAHLTEEIRDVRDHDVYFRAAYLANAALRMQATLDDGGTQRDALRAERRNYQLHEQARAGRLRAVAQVQTAADTYGQPTMDGTLVGWYLNPLKNNEAECIAANGHNFYAEQGTVIGLPGSVHNQCGCYAGPPWEGATAMVDDVFANLRALRPTGSTAKFKLKESRTA